MKHAPNMMDTSLEELRGLIERLDSRRLDEDDYPVVANVVATVMYLKQVHDDKSMSIKRLLDLLFGSVSSERRTSCSPSWKPPGSQRGKAVRKKTKPEARRENPKGTVAMELAPTRAPSESRWH